MPPLPYQLNVLIFERPASGESREPTQLYKRSYNLPSAGETKIRELAAKVQDLYRKITGHEIIVVELRNGDGATLSGDDKVEECFYTRIEAKSNRNLYTLQVIREPPSADEIARRDREGTVTLGGAIDLRTVGEVEATRYKQEEERARQGSRSSYVSDRVRDPDEPILSHERELEVPDVAAVPDSQAGRKRKHAEDHDPRPAPSRREDSLQLTFTRPRANRRSLTPKSESPDLPANQNGVPSYLSPEQALPVIQVQSSLPNGTATVATSTPSQQTQPHRQSRSRTPRSTSSGRRQASADAFMSTSKPKIQPLRDLFEPESQESELSVKKVTRLTRSGPHRLRGQTALQKNFTNESRESPELPELSERTLNGSGKEADVSTYDSDPARSDSLVHGTSLSPKPQARSGARAPALRRSVRNPSTNLIDALSQQPDDNYGDMIDHKTTTSDVEDAMNVDIPDASDIFNKKSPTSVARKTERPVADVPSPSRNTPTARKLTSMVSGVQRKGILKSNTQYSKSESPVVERNPSSLRRQSVSFVSEPTTTDESASNTETEMVTAPAHRKGKSNPQIPQSKGDSSDNGSKDESSSGGDSREASTNDPKKENANEEQLLPKDGTPALKKLSTTSQNASKKTGASAKASPAKSNPAKISSIKAAAAKASPSEVASAPQGTGGLAQNWMLQKPPGMSEYSWELWKSWEMKKTISTDSAPMQSKDASLVSSHNTPKSSNKQAADKSKQGTAGKDRSLAGLQAQTMASKKARSPLRAARTDSHGITAKSSSVDPPQIVTSKSALKAPHSDQQKPAASVRSAVSKAQTTKSASKQASHVNPLPSPAEHASKLPDSPVLPEGLQAKTATTSKPSFKSPPPISEIRGMSGKSRSTSASPVKEPVVSTRAASPRPTIKKRRIAPSQRGQTAKVKSASKMPAETPPEAGFVASPPMAMQTDADRVRTVRGSISPTITSENTNEDAKKIAALQPPLKPPQPASQAMDITSDSESSTSESEDGSEIAARRHSTRSKSRSPARAIEDESGSEKSSSVGSEDQSEEASNAEISDELAQILLTRAKSPQSITLTPPQPVHKSPSASTTQPNGDVKMVGVQARPVRSAITKRRPVPKAFQEKEDNMDMSAEVRPDVNITPPASYPSVNVEDSSSESVAIGGRSHEISSASSKSKSTESSEDDNASTESEYPLPDLPAVAPPHNETKNFTQATTEHFLSTQDRVTTQLQSEQQQSFSSTQDPVKSSQFETVDTPTPTAPAASRGRPARRARGGSRGLARIATAPTSVSATPNSGSRGLSALIQEQGRRKTAVYAAGNGTSRQAKDRMGAVIGDVSRKDEDEESDEAEEAEEDDDDESDDSNDDSDDSEKAHKKAKRKAARKKKGSSFSWNDIVAGKRKSGGML